ncbi:transposable element Tcb2 transposase [Trichonephila clavipes]|uniref:Transposable element Tcb2 transposase n=1 Tax=Trichonephila clavipes TaxID=2585209 RepID=A0A8X6S9G1_TRICX|nr:transposable element Tcb2 transposase [Trichonephila clavipes]
MDDNARPHRTLAVEELLESEDITRMDWSAYSPDLNPIEHVWDALGRRIAARLHHPENTQQLKQMLIEEWALLPQEMLHQQVLSMRRRCEATIAQQDGAPPHWHPSVRDWLNITVPNQWIGRKEPPDKCLSPPHAYTTRVKYITGWVSTNGTVGSNLKSDTQTGAKILWI